MNILKIAVLFGIDPDSLKKLVAYSIEQNLHPLGTVTSISKESADAASSLVDKVFVLKGEDVIINDLPETKHLVELLTRAKELTKQTSTEDKISSEELTNQTNTEDEIS
jgi:hypothetical protein